MFDLDVLVIATLGAAWFIYFMASLRKYLGERADA